MAKEPNGTLKVRRAWIRDQNKHAVYATIEFEDEDGVVWYHETSAFGFDLKRLKDQPIEQEIRAAFVAKGHLLRAVKLEELANDRFSFQFQCRHCRYEWEFMQQTAAAIRAWLDEHVSPCAGVR